VQVPILFLPFFLQSKDLLSFLVYNSIMATEIEILNNIRQDIRQYLGTASNTEVLSTLKAINATLQNLQNTMAKLQAPFLDY